MGRLISAGGCRVEIHDDHFTQDTEDAVLLREVGKQKWIFLTKDRRIAQNQIAIAALLQSGSPAFVFTVADMTSSEIAAAFLTALPQVKRLLSKFDWPFVATITPAGRVQMLVTHSGLIKGIR